MKNYLKFKFFIIYIVFWILMLMILSLSFVAVNGMYVDKELTETKYGVIEGIILFLGMATFIYPVYWVKKRIEYWKQSKKNSDLH
ncbi:Hypothetical Protein MfeM64YM_0847 [Mycoplasmopsis fermentans M64]|uniref:ICEF-IA ORF13 n=2 Tax=Mycoplasmopsis fermentans TaxID=2115 RepID=Q8G945_MYCFE|nr:ICEF-IA ORF13 [Mycoplasmopsis fermentans]ADV34383.1 Hypothetical Protein MfeM64YM_0381 [Mycoplasmopsis fermentans M64]AAN85267.1 ICEF-II ORF13 [Mycoplasmopsis fermentans]AAN85270.1 ICEF-II ORF13 [Mycoplasmopsis fermentans]ADV34451.1 Hypothetical Protein MfeM64YM_0452 [Mycoplasmopsis fermentans M64]